MNAEVFLDTNIIVYSFDGNSPKKRDVARKLMEREKWMVSWQTVQEFSNVALHRFEVPMKSEDLADYLELVLWPRCRVFPSVAIYQKALEIHRKIGYRFYDSLIVSSALAGGASILYSEDMESDRKIGALQIQNPF